MQHGGHKYIYICACYSPGSKPLSPRSDAKSKKKHYLMKDRTWGYLCTLCGNHGHEIADLKSMPCFPLPEIEEVQNMFKTPQVTSENSKPEAEAQALRAQLAELEEQEKQLSLLLELQQLHEQEALLMVQDLEEREAMQLAVALSESEAEAKVRDCEDKVAESSVATGESSGDKLVSFASAENIAANLIESSACPPDVSISC